METHEAIKVGMPQIIVTKWWQFLIHRWTKGKRYAHRLNGDHCPECGARYWAQLIHRKPNGTVYLGGGWLSRDQLPYGCVNPVCGRMQSTTKDNCAMCGELLGLAVIQD